MGHHIEAIKMDSALLTARLLGHSKPMEKPDLEPLKLSGPLRGARGVWSQGVWYELYIAQSDEYIDPIYIYIYYHWSDPSLLSLPSLSFGWICYWTRLCWTNYYVQPCIAIALLPMIMVSLQNPPVGSGGAWMLYKDMVIARASKSIVCGCYMIACSIMYIGSFYVFAKVFYR